MGKSIRKKRSLRKHKINPRKSMRKSVRKKSSRRSVRKSSRRSVRKSSRRSVRKSIRKRVNYNQKKYNLIGGSSYEGGVEAREVIPRPGAGYYSDDSDDSDVSDVSDISYGSVEGTTAWEGEVGPGEVVATSVELAKDAASKENRDTVVKYFNEIIEVIRNPSPEPASWEKRDIHRAQGYMEAIRRARDVAKIEGKSKEFNASAAAITTKLISKEIADFEKKITDRNYDPTPEELNDINRIVIWPKVEEITKVPEKDRQSASFIKDVTPSATLRSAASVQIKESVDDIIKLMELGKIKIEEHSSDKNISTLYLRQSKEKELIALLVKYKKYVKDFETPNELDELLKETIENGKITYEIIFENFFKSGPNRPGFEYEVIARTPIYSDETMRQPIRGKPVPIDSTFKVIERIIPTGIKGPVKVHGVAFNKEGEELGEGWLCEKEHLFPKSVNIPDGWVATAHPTQVRIMYKPTENWGYKLKDVLTHGKSDFPTKPLKKRLPEVSVREEATGDDIITDLTAAARRRAAAGRRDMTEWGKKGDSRYREIYQRFDDYGFGHYDPKTREHVLPVGPLERPWTFGVVDAVREIKDEQPEIKAEKLLLEVRKRYPELNQAGIKVGLEEVSKALETLLAEKQEAEAEKRMAAELVEVNVLDREYTELEETTSKEIYLNSAGAKNKKGRAPFFTNLTEKNKESEEKLKILNDKIIKGDTQSALFGWGAPPPSSDPGKEGSLRLVQSPRYENEKLFRELRMARVYGKWTYDEDGGKFKWEKDESKDMVELMEKELYALNEEEILDLTDRGGDVTIIIEGEIEKAEKYEGQFINLLIKMTNNQIKKNTTSTIYGFGLDDLVKETKKTLKQFGDVKQGDRTDEIMSKDEAIEAAKAEDKAEAEARVAAAVAEARAKAEADAASARAKAAADAVSARAEEETGAGEVTAARGADMGAGGEKYSVLPTIDPKNPEAPLLEQTIVSKLLNMEQGLSLTEKKQSRKLQADATKDLDELEASMKKIKNLRDRHKKEEQARYGSPPDTPSNPKTPPHPRPSPPVRRERKEVGWVFNEKSLQEILKPMVDNLKDIGMGVKRNASSRRLLETL